jgi:glycosyltransferase involved in cell wall biosynthesis
MRILMIGHKSVPSREGGIEVVVGELGTRMAALGHDVTFFNRKRKHEKGEKTISEYKGCHLEEVFTVNNKSLDAIVYSFFATLKAKKLAKAKKVDVIHYHAEGPCFFLWMFGKKHKGYKLVVTIHGLDWQRGKWGGLATKIIQKGEQRAVKYADDIIVLSKNNQMYFEQKYHRKTVFIPNGVNKPILRDPQIIKGKWGLEKNSYILFLGRIVPEKGVQYLVDAWKLVKKQIQTDKKLVIAGGSSHTDDYFKSICQKTRGDISIIMTGFVEGKTLQELYSNAYLYVLPSDIEGMPMSLLEALSYGNVCLVSNIPENTSVIDENSYVFEAGNVDRLRHQIKKIIRLNVQTHENMILPATWDEVTKKTLGIYNGVKE